MPTPNELAAKAEWTLITVLPMLGTPTHPAVYDMEFENDKTGANQKASTSLADQNPIPHYSDVCRYFADTFKCPVRIDLGKGNDPRYIQFTPPVDKLKKGKRKNATQRPPDAIS